MTMEVLFMGTRRNFRRGRGARPKKAPTWRKRLPMRRKKVIKRPPYSVKIYLFLPGLGDRLLCPPPPCGCPWYYCTLVFFPFRRSMSIAYLPVTTVIRICDDFCLSVRTQARVQELLGGGGGSKIFQP